MFFYLSQCFFITNTCKVFMLTGTLLSLDVQKKTSLDFY